MMGVWNLPAQAQIGSDLDFQLEQILVEYNGPQIVTARSDQGLFLGVAADEDEQAVRWIFAPISNIEFRALLAGAVATRDVFFKPRVLVIDYDHEDKPRMAWECDASLLSDENLPDPDVLLPKATREALLPTLPEPQAPELGLECVGSKRRSVPFRSLSEILSSLQRLWNALAQAVSADGPKERGRWATELSERASLSLAWAKAGSLILHIEPSDELVYEHTSKPFEDLVRAGDNPQALAEVLSRLGTRVQARYEELLTHIERHGLRLFMQRRGGMAFLAPHTASRIRLAMPQGVYGEPRTKPAVGHFLAFATGGTTATFEFFDESNDTTYRGQVHPDVLAENTAVAVGPGVTHAVFIEVTTRVTASKQTTETYVLRAIAPMPPPASRRSPETNATSSS